MFGLLNIDKPASMTSRDVVNIVQRLIRPDKVGHAGTLDPLATGVLVLPVGRATRLTELIHTVAKTYVGTFELGKVSDTEDIEGEVVARKVEHLPSQDEVQRVVAGFAGKQQQMPPAYSALKVNGKRSYELARRGELVELETREIEVYSIEVVSYDFPTLTICIKCSSGTYIRSLGRDIGQQLGTGAVMTALRRSAIGAFRVEDAVLPEFASREEVCTALRNPLEILSDFHQTRLSEVEQQEVFHGRRIAIAGVPGTVTLGVSSEDQLLSVLRRVDDSDLFRPWKNFFEEAT